MSDIAILVLALTRPSTSTAFSSAMPRSKTQSWNISRNVSSPSPLAHGASRWDTEAASVATATPELAQDTTAWVFRSGEDMSWSTCTCRGQKRAAGRGGGGRGVVSGGGTVLQEIPHCEPKENLTQEGAPWRSGFSPLLPLAGNQPSMTRVVDSKRPREDLLPQASECPWCSGGFMMQPKQPRRPFRSASPSHRLCLCRCHRRRLSVLGGWARRCAALPCEGAEEHEMPRPGPD